MRQNKFLNYVKSKNLFITSVFFIFFITGSQIYGDYGFYIDEKFHRANGFYWLNYLANYFGLENLSQISNSKLEEKAVGWFSTSLVSRASQVLYDKEGEKLSFDIE